MKKQAIISAGAGVALAAAFTTAAFGWSFNSNGTGVCLPDGSFKITWTVDNTNEPEALTVVETSNYHLVPNGTTVGAGDTRTFEQTVDGTKPATHNLWLKVKWPSDQNPQSRNAQVNLNEKCEQPQGGMGGGPIETPVTPVTPVAVAPAAAEAPQVAAPAGAVDAGGGINDGMMAVISAGIAGSLGIIGAALRRIAVQ